jgi:hypothetical protein
LPGNKMKYLLGILVAFVVLDGFLTQFLIDRGLASEINPFLQPIVGETAFIVLKILGALLCAFILWDVYRHFPRVGIIAAWIAVLGYGGILLWNYSIFLMD